MDQTFIEEKEEAGLDFKRYFSKLLRNWYWLVLSLLVFGLAAFFYLRYKVALYKVSSTILINAVKPEFDPVNILSAGTLSGSKPVENNTDLVNEIYIIQSTAMIGKVVDSMKLDVSITQYGLIKNQPFLPDHLPVTVRVKKSHPSNHSPLYKFTLTETGYTLEDEGNKYNGFYGTPLGLNGDTLLVSLKENAQAGDFKSYGLQLLSRQSTISRYLGRLLVTPVQKAGEGMLQIAVNDEIPERAKRFINVLIHYYNISNLQFQSSSTKLALDFLNERVAAVSKELDNQENEVADLKVRSQVYDVSESANQLLSNLGTLNEQRSANTLKQSLLEQVEKSIKSYDGKEDIIMNAPGLADPVLGDQINKYNQLVLQKRLILDQGTANDLRLPSLNGQLEQIRGNILSAVSNMRNEVKATDDQIASQERTYSGRFSTLPGKEKQYVQMNRTLGIKESLYVFLLQRREETGIQLVAADVAKFRMIEEGANHGVIEPQVPLVAGIAGGLGLLIPALIIFIRFVTNKKVETRKEIESGTNAPIVGQISLLKGGESIVVTTNGNRSVVSEQFRAMRTNLSYLQQVSTRKVILVTSCMSGEGKSFLSLNLANSVAITNKKVVLIELDMRKPSISKKLNIDRLPGMSDYLTSDIEPEEIIQQLEEYPNLYFISSGAIPPNPAELILSNRLEELMTFLKANFDMVVIDSPPVGLVSDAVTLGKMADLTLYVIRHNFSLRLTIKLVNDMIAQRKLPNLNIVINGIKAGKESDYGHGYGYGYGYGYGPSGDLNGNGTVSSKKKRKKEVENI